MAPSGTEVRNDVMQRYAKRTPRSRELDLRAKQHMPGGDTRTGMYYMPYPTYLEHGKGCIVHDYDGNEYIDFHNNASSLIHGHAFAPIVEAVREQVGLGTAFGGASEKAVRHAEILCARIPSFERVRYCNSGTEATLFCLRAARAFTGKDGIIKVEGGYHGSHDAVEVSVTPDTETVGPPTARLEYAGVPKSVLNDVIVAPFNDLDAMEATLRKTHDRVAAIIVEPMLFGGGALPREPGYLQGLRALADKYGVLLIFDEVVTFRMSTGGAQLIDNVKPDLTSLGKIMSGGLPGGAFGGRQDVLARWDPASPNRIGQGGTFNGNNLTMAAGIAALEHYQDADIKRINSLAERLKSGIDRELEGAGIKGRATGMGSLAEPHLTDRALHTGLDVAIGRKALGGFSRLLHLEMLNRGVYLPARGFYVVSTPMTEAHIDKALVAFRGAIELLKPALKEQAPHLVG
jgi:glutamate-1-semialdehyde 2,1-aminomutase